MLRSTDLKTLGMPHDIYRGLLFRAVGSNLSIEGATPRLSNCSNVPNVFNSVQNTISGRCFQAHQWAWLLIRYKDAQVVLWSSEKKHYSSTFVLNVHLFWLYANIVIDLVLYLGLNVSQGCTKNYEVSAVFVEISPHVVWVLCNLAISRLTALFLQLMWLSNPIYSTLCLGCYPHIHFRLIFLWK